MDDYMIELFSVPSETRPLPCSCSTCQEANYDPFIFDYTNIKQEDPLSEAKEPEITIESSVEESFSL